MNPSICQLTQESPLSIKKIIDMPSLEPEKGSLESETGLTDMTADLLNQSDLESTYSVEPSDKSKLIENLNITVTLDQPTPRKPAVKNENCHEERDNENEKQDVSETVEIVKEISDILNAKLSLKSANLCSRLLFEEGADPIALAQVLKQWRKNKIPKQRRELGNFFRPIAPLQEKPQWIP